MKKKWILILAALTCLGMSFYISSHVLTKTAEHYAETMARDIAIGYTIDRQHLDMEEQCELPFLPSPSQAYEMLVEGPPIDGWIAIFNSEGQLLEGSAGSKEAPEITRAIKSIFSEGGKRVLSLGWTKIAVVLGWDGKLVGIDGEYAVVVTVSRYFFPKAMPLERLFMCLSFYNCCTIGLFICFLLSLHHPLVPLHHPQQVSGIDTGLAARMHDNVLQALIAAIREINLVEVDGFENASDELCQHFMKAKYILSLSVKEVRKICDEISPEWMEFSPDIAFEAISREMSLAYKVKVITRVELNGQVPEKPQTLCFGNILKAYIENAVNLKNAGEVTAHLTYKDKAYILMLEDNGARNAAVGLGRLAKLVKQLGGRLSLLDGKTLIILVP